MQTETLISHVTTGQCQPGNTKSVRRVEGLFALADPLEERLAKARGQVQ